MLCSFWSLRVYQTRKQIYQFGHCECLLKRKICAKKDRAPHEKEDQENTPHNAPQKANYRGLALTLV
jgi:hypothetical protein